MPDRPPWWSSFCATVYGKVIAALVVVSLLLGVAIEIVTFQKLTYDRDISRAESEAKNARAVDITGDRQPRNDTQLPHQTTRRYSDNAAVDTIIRFAILGVGGAIFGLVLSPLSIYWSLSLFIAFCIFASPPIGRIDFTAATIMSLYMLAAMGLGRYLGRYVQRQTNYRASSK